MRISIILAHPNPGSFNHAIAKVVADTLSSRGNTVILHDLYAEKFDPLLPTSELGRTEDLPPEVRKHVDEIVSVDGIVIVHPNWWGMPPAILKGWVDRSIRAGSAYTFQGGQAVGLMKARSALVLHTANTPPDVEVELYGDPLDNLWRKCIFGLCGIRNVRRELFAPVIISTPDQRQAWLKTAAEAALQQFHP